MCLHLKMETSSLAYIVFSLETNYLYLCNIWLNVMKS